MQFWASLIAGSLAFGLGIGLVLYVVWTPGLTAQAAVVEFLLGLVLNAASVLFFRQMEQTRERADKLYDRLRGERKCIQAVEVANSICDSTLQGNTQAKLATRLAGLDQDAD